METDPLYNVMYAVYERAVQDLIELAEWYEKNHDRKIFPETVYYTSGEYIRKAKSDNFYFKWRIFNRYEFLLNDAIKTITDDSYNVIFDNRDKIYKTVISNIKSVYPEFYKDYRELLKCIEI